MCDEPFAHFTHDGTATDGDITCTRSRATRWSPPATRRALLQAGLLAGVTAAFGQSAHAQEATGTPAAGTPTGQPGPPRGGPGDEEAKALAEPFVGITTDGQVVPNLFPVEATSVPTAPIQQAAEAFLASLSADQRKAVQFAVDDPEWRKWNNVDNYPRQGLSLRQLSGPQQQAGLALLAASLSPRGGQLAQNIMLLNHVLGELANDVTTYDQDLYWFTVMGEPSPNEPWGWQLDGHHLVLNCFVLGDQVVLSPAFFGSEPTVAPVGTSYAGLSVLQEQQDAGLVVVNALTEAQQAQAILAATKPDYALMAGAFADNLVLPPAGITVTDLGDGAQQLVLDLLATWVGTMDRGHAQVRMDEVQAHLDETRFAWMGGTDPDAVFYYRVHSPVILVEFDHQPPGPLGKKSDFYQGGSGPSRFHIHAVVRTPNGNDYGKDLLAEHYAASPHHATPAAPAASPVNG
jgi:hypothetical protein